MSSKLHHHRRVIWMTMTVVSVSLVILLLAQQPLAVGDSPQQMDDQGGANIIALGVQIYPGSEAIALIDKDRQTLCLYQYRPDAAPHESFVLLAARHFRYDFMLETFNNAEPTPDDIRKMVEQIMPPTPTTQKLNPVATPEPGQKTRSGDSGNHESAEN